jgi:hypothetical protein
MLIPGVKVKIPGHLMKNGMAFFMRRREDQNSLLLSSRKVTGPTLVLVTSM